MATVSKLKPNKASTTEPPATLSPPAREAWTKLVVEYNLHGDVAAQMLLTSAMACWDRAQLADAQLKRDGLTVKAKTGRVLAHPAAAIARDSWSAYHRAMRALDLETAAPQAPLGRPPYLDGVPPRR